jgi:excisionase family DNA binding protein
MKPLDKQDRLLDLDEVCAFLRVTKSYIYRLTSRREIPYYKVSGLRLSLQEIQGWLEKQKIAQKAPKTFEDLTE